MIVQIWKQIKLGIISLLTYNITSNFRIKKMLEKGKGYLRFHKSVPELTAFKKMIKVEDLMKSLFSEIFSVQFSKVIE